MEILPTLQLLLLLTGGLSLSSKVVHKKAGELVVLRCPSLTHSKDTPVWTGPTRNRTHVASASADPSQPLILGGNLVILRVSGSHQGDYSCSVRNGSSRFWLQLKVHTNSSDEDEERRWYPSTCYTHESCRLFCPAVDVPAEDTPSISSRGVTWHRKGEATQTHNFFSSVEEKDSGVYTCTRSYSYSGHMYNTSFTVALQVKANKQLGQSQILSPKQNDVFPAVLGSTVVIHCDAVVSSNFDELFWLSESSFVEPDENFPVFYNYSRTETSAEMKMTASLVFKNVSEEDLLKKFTCKLQPAQQASTFVTVTLSQRADLRSSDPSDHILSIRTIVLLLVAVATVVVVVVVVYCRYTPGCRGGSPRSPDPGSGSHLLNNAAPVENQIC